MELSTIELRKLTAAEGMTLTNGKVFGKVIYIGKNDNPDNWYEITDKEAEEQRMTLLVEDTPETIKE